MRKTLLVVVMGMLMTSCSQFSTSEMDEKREVLHPDDLFYYGRDKTKPGVAMGQIIDVPADRTVRCVVSDNLSLTIPYNLQWGTSEYSIKPCDVDFYPEGHIVSSSSSFGDFYQYGQIVFGPLDLACSCKDEDNSVCASDCLYRRRYWINLVTPRSKEWIANDVYPGAKRYTKDIAGHRVVFVSVYPDIPGSEPQLSAELIGNVYNYQLEGGATEAEYIKIIIAILADK